MSLSRAQGISGTVLYHVLWWIELRFVCRVSEASLGLLLSCLMEQFHRAMLKFRATGLPMSLHALQAREGSVLMDLLCFYIMSYIVPHMVYAVFVLVA